VVIKDAGDDPDVTHGAEIGVWVGWAPGPGPGERLEIAGGPGVGRVTKPGLPVAVGEPAVNPVPRRMLRQALSQAWEAHGNGRPLQLRLEIFVPRGEELARHTLNPRLGIVGGISILGTTGLVRPYSHAAWRATIVAALKVARAQGRREAVFTTGGRSEAALRGLRPELPPECFVLMGDYVRFSLRAAAHLGFRRVTVGAFFGKAVKMAQGFGQTHASRGLVDFAVLGRWVGAATGDSLLAREAAGANTVRQVLEMLPPAAKEKVAAEVGRRLLTALRLYAGPELQLSAVILDYDGLRRWQGEG
jgi:cobalt-precorrin-5B (C1)-methyltransferase